MKKTILLLALAAMLLLTACGQTPTTDPVADENPTEKVTIYIPATTTAVKPDGTEQITMRYVLEEGWQDKERFSLNVQVEDPSGLLDEEANMVNLMTITYSEKRTVQGMGGNYSTETVFDENGRAISQTMTYLIETAPYEKKETFMTYDAFGRLLTQETKTYTRGETEPQVTVTTVNYTETDIGSEGRSEDGDITYVRVYDKNYRLVCQSTLVNGEELTRTEQEFDVAGNMVRMVSYSYGQKMVETAYTFTAVEVSAEFAARMPQFNREK